MGRVNMADTSPTPSVPATPTPSATRYLLIRATLEAALIVMSVLLALFLDGWREEREISERVETARTFLIREVRANRDELRSDIRLPYHLRTVTLLADVAGEPGRKRDAALTKLQSGAFTGVHPFRAQDVAWSTFRNAELTSRLPASELFLLARIYDAQEGLEALSEASYAGMIQPSADAESEAFQRSQLNSIRTYFADAIPVEQELLRMYDRALRELDPPTAAR